MCKRLIIALGFASVCVGFGTTAAVAQGPAQGGSSELGGALLTPDGGDVAVAVPNGVVAYAVESTDAVLEAERVAPVPADGRTLVPRMLPGAAALKPLPASENALLGGGSVLPPLVSETLGISFEGPAICGCEPPDPILTVGPSHVLMGINNQIRAANKSNGSTVWSVSWNSFFNSVRPAGAAFTSDPKVMFDPVSQRFFAMILFINNNQSKSWWMLAISDSSSITSSTVWTKWALDPTIAAPGFFADYPGFGFDGNAIYITSNMFGSTVRVDMAVIPKAQLIAGTATVSFTQLTDIRQSNNVRAFTIQPAHMFGTGDAFFVSSTGGNASTIYFYRVNNPLGSPTLTKSSRFVGSYSFPPNAAQSGGGSINTGDTRLFNAVWQNNSLWCAHNTNSGGRSAARWYEFDTSAWPSAPTTVQSGTVTGTGLHYYYPTVAVDQSNNAAIGFSRSSSSEFASAWHTSRNASDPLGTMNAPTLDHSGNTNYGGGRWGDYSGTVIDPTNGVFFWTMQEFAKNGSWSNWVSSFSVGVGDTTPPTPDPMQWEPGGEPAPTSTTAITMQAVLATDTENGVEYLFARLSGPGSPATSGWQATRSYTDTGLIANTQYSYTTAARDTAGVPNVTNSSVELATATLIETPTTVSFGTVTENSIQVTADGAFTNLLTSSSGLFFEMTPAVGTGANVWVQSQTITVTGLSPSTLYSFRVKARNLNKVETAFGTSNSTTTPAPSCALPGDVSDDGLVNGLDIAGFVRVKLGTPDPLDNAACADFGNGGDLALDTADFVAALLAP